MPTANEPTTTYDNGWIVRSRPPVNTPAARILLLLHGWTGDETVMWIFTRAVPEDYWIFAPRGPVPSPESGYGWLPHDGGWPSLDDFTQVAAGFMDVFQRWISQTHSQQKTFDVMGFSQGAAMAYALAAYFPQQVNRVLSLAGFLPRDDPMPGRYSSLRGKKIYIAHGTKDETVPVGMAQETVRTLQQIGAQVTYCESDTGHKLSAGCLRGLGHFLN